MGNIVLVKKVLSGNICPSTKKFNLEDLIKNEIVRAVYRKFAGETGQYHDEYCSLTEIFDDFEKQENSNDDDNWKKNLIKELNELHTAGLSTPDFWVSEWVSIESKLNSPRGCRDYIILLISK